jgi:hypothetical protein
LHTPAGAPEPNQPDRRYPTIIIVHGFNHDPNDPSVLWPQRMADKIVELIRDENSLQSDPNMDVLVDDINIAFWNWGYYPIIDSQCCYRATAAAGQELGGQLERLMDAGTGTIDPDPSRIHLIGYSDGGYVCAACAHSIATSGRGRIGQLTGLDVPQKYDPTLPDSTIDPNDFDAVTWYPLPGIQWWQPIGSLPLHGPNVISEDITAPDVDPDVYHTDVPDWYIDRKIVRGDDWGSWWDSWVAVKRAYWPRNCTGRFVLDVSYKLECQGLDGFDGSGQRILAEPASEADQKHYVILPSSEPLSSIQLEREISSGSVYPAKSKVIASGSGSVTSPLATCSWLGGLLALRTSGWAEWGSAYAKGTINSIAEVAWGSPLLDAMGEHLPSLLVVQTFGSEPQRLQWQGHERTLLGTTLGGTRESLLNVDEGLTITSITSHWESEVRDGVVPTASAGFSIFELGVDMGFEGVRLGSGSSAAFICPPKLKATLFANSASLHRKGAGETIWGGDIKYEETRGEETRGDSVSFVPGRPGLCVIRYRLSSTDDDSTAGTNVTIFVPGER